MSVSRLADQAEQLRALHVPGLPLLLVNAWDPPSARRLAHDGYPAIATTSAGVAEALGYEDGNVTPPDEMLAAVARIARAVSVPVTADLEAGYGLEPGELARRLTGAGAVGLNLEDTDHANHPALQPVEEQARRIAAVKAGADLVLNARIDVHIRGGATEEALARARAEGKRAKLIYTIPTFQNPMGTTFSAERRTQLIELAARNKVLIIEDDPYGDLRFTGARVPSVFSLAGGEGVIKAGTFSKIIATGLRAGWIEAKKEYVDATLRMRFDNGTSPFVLRTIAAYIEQGTLEPHIETMCRVYASKCDAMLSALAESCAGLATWTQPEGGFFIWLTFDEDIPLADVMRLCDEERVAVVPGTSFYADGGGRNNLRLAFSNVAENQITEGIKRLARALQRAQGVGSRE